MTRFLYDTAIFVYALGGEHRYEKPCKRVIAMAAGEEIRGEASVDLLQELANQRFRKTGDRAGAVEAARQAAALCRPLHDLRRKDAMLALDLYGRHPRLCARDAVFAAVALGRGINVIVATDRAFDDVPGLERIDPADEAAVESLTA